jgi:hypothetical protein
MYKSEMFLAEQTQRMRAFRLLSISIQQSRVRCFPTGTLTKTAAVTFPAEGTTFEFLLLSGVSCGAIPSIAAWILVRNAGPNFHPFQFVTVGEDDYFPCLFLRLSAFVHPKSIRF